MHEHFTYLEVRNSKLVTRFPTNNYQLMIARLGIIVAETIKKSPIMQR